ncbi:MAG TPA: (2Fe-2S)-binding protein [Phycisphaerales bacterium]|nr:(2Fe-2S)-binding protein [Phycisphaerales bacterium]
MSVKKHFSFVVNGENHTVESYPANRLLDVLREDLRLTGCKEGCGEGECGSCSVFLDDVMVNSCLVPIAQVQGREIRTVEALSSDPLGKILQEKFLEHNGAQCGICTPGMLVAAITLLRRTSEPTLGEIQDGLAGNLCRCTGYKKIFDAVADAANVARERGVLEGRKA